MTVKELIQSLSQHEPTATVCFQYNDDDSMQIYYNIKSVYEDEEDDIVLTQGDEL